MLPSGRTPSEHVALAPVYAIPLHCRKFFEHYEAAKDQKNESKALRQSWCILNLMRQLYRIEAQL